MEDHLRPSPPVFRRRSLAGWRYRHPQVAYYLTATDGYTDSVSPGIDYLGDYIAIAGGPAGVVLSGNVSCVAPGCVATLTGQAASVVVWPVHVTEPPHLVHVPALPSPASQSVTLTAYSNCSTPSCTAKLFYRPAGGDTWSSVDMTVTPPSQQQPLDTYTGTIPAAARSGDVDYYLTVTDGYTGEQTSTYTLRVSPA